MMDTSDEIKSRYASEAKTYREDAIIINFDAKTLFNKFVNIIKTVYPDKETKLKVLDLGAGNGMLTELVYNEYKNAEFTMFDFSEGMLESAKYIFEDNMYDINVTYVTGNFITDDFPDEEYDLIISSYALHHVRTPEELKRVYAKISKHLKKTGIFLCLDNYLGETEEERIEQINISLNNWEKSYNSRTKALEWGSILEGEDSPATIKTIISLIKSTSSTPLLISDKGTLATIYGLCKLDESEIESIGLSDLVKSWKNNKLYTDNVNEYLISNYQYSKYREE